VAEILIPKPLREKAREAPTHWDVYFVTVLLKDGCLFRNLAAREGVCITGKASASGVVNPLPFAGEDIVDVEPYYPPLYNLLTFFAWLLGRLFYAFKPKNAVPFSEVNWAPRRRLYGKRSAQ
jgi:hypothetical protein